MRNVTPFDTYGEHLGGGWVFDERNKECITSIEYVLRTATMAKGYCTQVARVADNEGWDPDQLGAALG